MADKTSGYGEYVSLRFWSPFANDDVPRHVRSVGGYLPEQLRSTVAKTRLLTSITSKGTTPVQCNGKQTPVTALCV